VKNLLLKIQQKKLESSVISLCLVLFALLLFKDVFSARTLIPNFEPFPDTFNYINPALSLLNGTGLKIVREGRAIDAGVPPLYSLILAPFFLISKDPRVFYFTNFLLSIGSAAVFYLIIARITKSVFIRGFSLFLFVTNYYIYWYPNLAMAENLILPLFLVGIFLLMEKVSFKKAVLAGFLGVGFYATKYASLPLTVVFSTLYFFKIIFSQKNRKLNLKLASWFLLSFAVFFLLLTWLEYISKGTNLFLTVFGFFHKSIEIATSSSDHSVATSGTPDHGWFSSYYIQSNLPDYLRALLGQQTRFLWSSLPLIPKFVGVLGLVGLGLGFVKKRFRFISLSLCLTLFSTILFMSTFYSLDARYIYNTIPTLLIGFAILMAVASEALGEKRKIVFYILAGGLLLYYLLGNALILKNQITLNLRHGETPWYYVSVLNLNDFMTKDKIVDGKKPIVISPMVPYLIDYYSNGNYTLLPLSKNQDYRDHMAQTWGPNDYSDLIKLYNSYLEKGFDVYVEIYGLGNVSYLHQDFDTISKKFDLTMVKDGCFSQCNIYQLKEKNK